MMPVSWGPRLRTRLVLTALFVICHVTYAEAASSELTVRLFRLGSTQPTSATCTWKGKTGEVLGSQTQRTGNGGFVFEVPTGAESATIEASGYETANLPRAHFRFGVSLQPLGKVSIRRLNSTIPSGKLYGVRDSGPVQDLGFVGTGTISIPSGSWWFLVAESNGAVLVGPQVVASGATHTVLLVRPDHESVHFRVQDQYGVIVGAQFEIAADGTPRSRLLSRWLADKHLRTDLQGELTVTESQVHAKWLVTAANHRPTTYETRESLPTHAIQLSLLPRIKISLASEGTPLQLPIEVEVRLVPESPGETPRGGVGALRPLWKGVLTDRLPVAEMPVSAAGHYRARAVWDGLVAINDVLVPDLVSAPDLQTMVVTFARRKVWGTVSRGLEPLPGVRVEAFPPDKFLGAETPLASAETSESGRYELPVSVNRVWVGVRLPSGTRHGEVIDLADHPDGQLDLSLRPGSVRVHISAKGSDLPIPNATVRTDFRGGTDPRRRTSTSSTNDKGDVLLEDIGIGLLSLAAESEGYATARRSDIAIADTEGQIISLMLSPSGSLRLLTVDPGGYPLPNVSVLQQRDPRVIAPRLAPLVEIGSTDQNGELFLDKLLGEKVPVFAVQSGYATSVAVIPASVDPDDDPEQRTVTIVLNPYTPTAGIKIVDKAGRVLPEAIVLLNSSGIDVPLSVLRRVAAANGLQIEALMRPDREGYVHIQDLLAPGTYAVFALSPGTPPSRVYDPTKDVRDLLGTIVLPNLLPATLTWSQDRPSWQLGQP